MSPRCFGPVHARLPSCRIEQRGGWLQERVQREVSASKGGRLSFGGETRAGDADIDRRAGSMWEERAEFEPLCGEPGSRGSPLLCSTDRPASRARVHGLNRWSGGPARWSELEPGRREILPQGLGHDPDCHRRSGPQRPAARCPFRNCARPAPREPSPARIRKIRTVGHRMHSSHHSLRGCPETILHCR